MWYRTVGKIRQKFFNSAREKNTKIDIQCGSGDEIVTLQVLKFSSGWMDNLKLLETQATKTLCVS